MKVSNYYYSIKLKKSSVTLTYGPNSLSSHSNQSPQELDWAGLVQTGLVRVGLLQAGLGWAGLGWIGLLWDAVGTMLRWTEVVEGHGGQEAVMLRLDCVSLETSLLIPHKPDHGLLVFV